MTPLPKRRHSTRRQGKRTAALSVGGTQLTKCPQCGAVVVAHMVCDSCGFYKGKSVIHIRTKTKKGKS